MKTTIIPTDEKQDYEPSEPNGYAFCPRLLGPRVTKGIHVTDQLQKG